MNQPYLNFYFLLVNDDFVEIIKGEKERLPHPINVTFFTTKEELEEHLYLQKDLCAAVFIRTENINDDINAVNYLKKRIDVSRVLIIVNSYGKEEQDIIQKYYDAGVNIVVTSEDKFSVEERFRKIVEHYWKMLLNKDEVESEFLII